MATESLANPLVALPVAVAGTTSGTAIWLGLINGWLALVATSASIIVAVMVIRVQRAKLRALERDE